MTRTWCAHPIHPQPCPGHITVDIGKKKVRVDCPCARAEIEETR